MHASTGSLLFYCPLGIGTAYAVLSDPDKKARYDEYGETLEPARRGRRQFTEFEREFDGLYFAGRHDLLLLTLFTLWGRERTRVSPNCYDP